MNLEISGDRLLKHLNHLKSISSGQDAGVTRLVYSGEDDAARSWLVEEMHLTGLSPSIDGVGNVEGRPGEDDIEPIQTVMSGSHMDTVANGGAYDGSLGVVSALEAASCIRESGRSKAVGVVSFAGEESTRFGVGCIGSRAMAGHLEDADLDRFVDEEGESLRLALSSSGLDPARLLDARISDQWAKAFVELHIDQGDDLFEAGVPIGVVTSIAGPLRQRICVYGRAAHSGATPIAARHDALAAASEIVLRVEELAFENEREGAWATVGDLHVTPGSFNTVPGMTVLDIEIRAFDDDSMARVDLELGYILEDVRRTRDIRYDKQVVSLSKPAMMTDRIISLIEDVCDSLGVPSVRVSSRPVHDSSYISKHVPTGMILVRNSSGISHSPDEAIDPDDVVTGAIILANVILALSD